jgi:hypothetical protein
MGGKTPRDEARVNPLMVDGFYPAVLWVEAFLILVLLMKNEALFTTSVLGGVYAA